MSRAEADRIIEIARTLTPEDRALILQCLADAGYMTAYRNAYIRSSAREEGAELTTILYCFRSQIDDQRYIVIAPSVAWYRQNIGYVPSEKWRRGFPYVLTTANGTFVSGVSDAVLNEYRRMTRALPVDTDEAARLSLAEAIIVAHTEPAK